MPGPSIPAMDVHLQRYGTSDAGDDNDSDTHAPRGGGDADATSFWGVVFADTSHPLPNNVRIPSLELITWQAYNLPDAWLWGVTLCMYPYVSGVTCRTASSYKPRAALVSGPSYTRTSLRLGNINFMTSLCRFQVLARWWRQHHPFIAQFIHEYGSILVQYLTPFTPGAARRAGYCCASHVLRRSLDRVDVELPGAEGGWSSRWRSRCPKNRGTALPGRIGSVYTAIGGAGVAAVVVLLAAAGTTESCLNV